MESSCIFSVTIKKLAYRHDGGRREGGGKYSARTKAMVVVRLLKYCGIFRRLRQGNPVDGGDHRVR